MAVVRLRVLDGSTIELRDGVPATRAECPTTRPCPHIRCQYHLWLDAFDSHWNSAAGEPCRPSRLLPRWLESPMPASCALDVADRGTSGEVLGYRELGKLLGLGPHRVEGILSRAKRRIKRELARGRAR